MIIGQDRRIISMNSAASRFLESGREGAEPVDLLDIVHTEDRGRIQDLLADPDGQVHGIRTQAFRMIVPGGPVVPVEAAISRVLTEGENKGARILCIHNMSSISLERDILQKTLNTVSILDSTIRHDILNQLTILVGYLQLTEELKMEPELQGYLKLVADAAHAIHTQMTSTRQFSSIGLKPPLWQPVTSIIASTHALVPEKNITITESLGDLQIFADPFIERAFAALIDFASKNAPPVTTLAFKSEARDGDLILVVQADAGSIPDREKQKLFEKEYTKKVGYGLFTARHILGLTDLVVRENGDPAKGIRFEISAMPGRVRIRKGFRPAGADS